MQKCLILSIEYNMNKKERIDAGRQEYPGMAVNTVKDAKADKGLEAERTAVLNNNPRNTEFKKHN